MEKVKQRSAATLNPTKPALKQTQSKHDTSSSKDRMGKNLSVTVSSNRQLSRKGASTVRVAKAATFNL